MRLDGTGLRRLTNDNEPDYDPYQSPDGRLISWTKAHLTPFSIWNYGMIIMDSDGSNERAVIDDGAANGKPTWAADSRTIYFHRKPIGRVNGFTIWRIRADGSGLTEITKTDELAPPVVGAITSPGAHSDEFPDVLRPATTGR